MKQLILFLLSISLFSCTKDELTNPIVEIQYGPHERNIMDYNYVSSTCYLFIHGGGWTTGDKSDWADIHTIINSHGYSYAAINYRLLPTTNYIGMQEDLDKAVQFLYSQGIKHIVLVGGSAGSHIALLYATTHKIDKVITIGTISTTNDYLCDFLKPAAKQYGNVSVIDSTFNCKLVLLHYENDTITDIQQSKQLQKHGAELIVVPGTGHYLPELQLYQFFNQIL